MNGTKKEIDTIIGFLTAGPLDPNAGKVYLIVVVMFSNIITCLSMS